MATFGSPYIHMQTPSPCQNSLQLEWVFGLSNDYKAVIHNLSAPEHVQHTAGTTAQAGSMTTATTRKVLYTVAHTGVVYDVIHNLQQHLIGHRHTIISSACSHSHRFIVTADEGDVELRRRWQHQARERYTQHWKESGGRWENTLLEEAEEEEKTWLNPAEALHEEEEDGSTMIVWDATTALPLRVIPTGKYGGVLAVTMSLDGHYIATINRRDPQEIMIWSWTHTEEHPNNSTVADIKSSGKESTRGSKVDQEPPLPVDLSPVFVRRIPSQDEQTSIRFSHDDQQLLCASGPHRIFFWSWAEGILKYYSPPIIQRRLKTSIGSFTCSMYIPGTTLACSGTVDGDVILWALQPKDRVMKDYDKSLLKTVRVHTGGVTFLTTSQGYIVTGGMDGSVKFLDTKLRLVAWFDELNGGPIISISFDRPLNTVEEARDTTTGEVMDHLQVEGTTAASVFTAPDFMVSTAHSMIIDVPAKAFHTANGAADEVVRGRLIVQGQDQSIECLAAHPKLSRVAIGGLSGNLHLWDYVQHRVLVLILFRNLYVRCIAFDPQGTILVVGFTNGLLKVLDAETFEEVQVLKPLSEERKGVTVERICFSSDGRMMATATSEGCVGLYEYTAVQHDSKKQLAWQLVGHHKTHKASICGLQFGSHTGSTDEAVRLLSVGSDKRLIEYNLTDSSPETGLLLRTAHKISQDSVPTGFAWLPTGSSLLDTASQPREKFDDMDFETNAMKGLGATSNDANMASPTGSSSGNDALDFLLIATNDYKLQIYLSNWSRQCVKKVLAPTFGGPVTSMAVVPIPQNATQRKNSANGQSSPLQMMQNCMVYSTNSKVVGLVQLPLRGDPCASVGVLGHPGIITSMVVSYDGIFAFTAGGEDQSMMQWRIDGTKILPPSAIDAARRSIIANRGGVPLDHLLNAVEGGHDGELIKEVVDYFYYSQIRAQGEETTAKRELLGAIPFSQMPNLLRALGYYPSELEIGHLTYEVANMYGPPDVALAAMDVDTILLDFSQFMRLYINYRPVYGISRQDIEQAFLALGANPVTGKIGRDHLFQLLSTKGEPLKAVEISAALTSLLGDGIRMEMLEDEITARTFAENLLGFEDYSGNAESDAAVKNGREHAQVEGEDPDSNSELIYGDMDGMMAV